MLSSGHIRITTMLLSKAGRTLMTIDLLIVIQYYFVRKNIGKTDDFASFSVFMNGNGRLCICLINSFLWFYCYSGLIVISSIWLLTWEWDAGERGYIYSLCTFLYDNYFLDIFWSCLLKVDIFIHSINYRLNINHLDYTNANGY